MQFFTCNVPLFVVEHTHIQSNDEVRSSINEQNEENEDGYETNDKDTAGSNTC